MRRWRSKLVTGAALLAVPLLAHAADRPVVGPPAAWVRAEAPPPAPSKAAEGAAVALLAHDVQLHFDAAGQSEYTASQVKVQAGSGLAALGALTFAWAPATDLLTVHRLRILRGGEVIDLLPKKGEFTILRREAQLESAAMLDGVLTAVVEPEGLQVGDVLDVAYTLRREDPLTRGKVDALAAISTAAPLARFRLVATWPTTLGVRWRSLDGAPEPRVTEHDGVSTAQVEFADLRPQPAPQGAPARFRLGRQLVFSNYPAWADVAALMAPLYLEASRLAPGSVVAAKAREIAGRTSDPAERASAALALVQDQVRYLAQVAGELGLKPAAADVTWARRYGDCKGKTVLLLALLRELGIEAEPVLASSAFGDGLDERPPRLSEFDHVLVRARVGGRDYWLDGTRVGDRTLASVSTPAFGFVLPVRLTGSTLVALRPEPAKRPLSQIDVRIDATKGIDAPAPFHVDAVFRGDGATALRLQLSNLAPDDLQRGLKEYWRKEYDFVTPARVSAAFDTATGEERLAMDGEARLDWSNGGYEADGASIGWRFDAHRDAGPHLDAPFAVAFPAYDAHGETILLPDHGRGFSIWGDDTDRRLAGYAFHRAASVEKGVFRLETSAQALQPEISAAQARADAAPLTELSKVTLRLRTPAQTATAQGVEAGALADSAPDTRDGYIARGFARLDLRRYDDALRDFGKALELDGGSAQALAGRALARVWMGQPAAAAQADLDRAETIDAKNATVWRARGLLAERERRYPDAVAAYERSLKLEPDSSFALFHLAQARVWEGDLQKASAYAEAELRDRPASAEGHVIRALVLARGEDRSAFSREVALVTPDAARDDVADTLYARMTDRPRLRQLLDAQLAAKPSAHVHMLRASTRGQEERADIYADVRAALALAPDAYDANMTLARLSLQDGKGAEALAYARTAAAHLPDPNGASAVAAVEARVGDKAVARAMFTKLRAASPDAVELNNLCYDQATAGLDLDKALADCDASLKLRPGDAATLDSRGFVLLRLGRDAEARAAYDAALAKLPTYALPLYGRSLAGRRLGDAAAADRDLQAAKAQNPRVAAIFAAYGVER